MDSTLLKCSCKFYSLQILFLENFPFLTFLLFSHPPLYSLFTIDFIFFFKSICSLTSSSYPWELSKHTRLLDPVKIMQVLIATNSSLKSGEMVKATFHYLVPEIRVWHNNCAGSGSSREEPIRELNPSSGERTNVWQHWGLKRQNNNNLVFLLFLLPPLLLNNLKYSRSSF